MLRGLVCAMAIAGSYAYGQAAAGSVTGTVVDVTGGGVPALVTIEGPMPMAGKFADRSGKFEVVGLPRGMYTLRIQCDGFRPQEIDVQVEEGKETSVGQVTMELVPPPTCTGGFKTAMPRELKLDSDNKSKLSGSTRVETGEVLTDFTMTLLTAGKHEVVGSTDVGKGGRFEFVYVPPGVYELVVSSKGQDITRIRNLKVTKGRELDVRLIWTALPKGYVCL